MDPALALQILQWVAIVVVYLGFAAVLRESRMLRAQVSRLQERLASLPAGSSVEAAAGAGDPLRLPAGLAGDGGVVVAADTTCPSCALVLEALARPRGDALPITVLTWEDPGAWADRPHVGGEESRLRLVRDDAAWTALAHLTPPVLALVDADGLVRDVRLPVDGADADAALAAWGSRPVDSGVSARPADTSTTDSDSDLDTHSVAESRGRP